MCQSWKPSRCALISCITTIKKQPPIDRETFTTLAKIASCDVLMSTHDGYYKQVDGLAMGSPPAPHLANGWLSQFDNIIKGKARLYARYMDNILQDIKREEIEDKLSEINNLHSALKFTIEREVDGAIPFLDMRIMNTRGRLTSTWYNKPTDTGRMMNYHALAPKRYKRSVVSGVVHRIHRACSTWQNFHDSLEKAKRILERNQYPPTFYEPIIKTLDSIIGTEHKNQKNHHLNPVLKARSTLSLSSRLQRKVHRGLCSCLTSLQCPMYDNNDSSEAENCPALFEPTCG